MHKNKFRRVVLSAAAAIGLALGGVAFAAPAQACDPAKQCGYIDQNFTGGTYQQKFSNANLAANTTFNDKFSSLRNAKTVAACYYLDSNYGGLAYAVSAGYEVVSLTSTYVDKISSLKSC